nr:YiiX/YebB-like N1pC/P60 family cysteine hydrolase [Spirochaetota bacterium]
MLPALAIALSLLCAAPDFSRLAEGDIIFQETSGRQSDAIALATKSRYTHVGIVFREKGRWMVLEAVQPVSSIALERWIARGVKRHYVVKRLA